MYNVKIDKPLKDEEVLDHFGIAKIIMPKLNKEGKLEEKKKGFVGNMTVIYKNGVSIAHGVWKSKFKDAEAPVYMRLAHTQTAYVDDKPTTDDVPVGFTYRTGSEDGGDLKYTASTHIPREEWKYLLSMLEKEFKGKELVELSENSAQNSTPSGNTEQAGENKAATAIK